MNSILSKAITGRIARAQKVVAYAPEGFGKTTLAAQFPEPLFFDLEGSTAQLDVARLTRDSLCDLPTFESALAEVAKVRPCKTLVTDTVDWLESIVLADVIATAGNPKIKGVEDFGYGKGYTYLKERFEVTLARLDDVLRAGINVVLLAHSFVRKFEPPDGAGPYDRYELKLSKHVAPLLKEWADMLLFCNWKTQVREKDKNESGAQFKGVGGKERVIYCNRTAAWDAKNRHGMKDEEKWGADAGEAIKVIERAFRNVGAPWGDAAPQVSSGKEAAPHEVTTPSPAPLPVEKPAEVAAPSNPAPAADTLPPDIARICEPHGEAVTAFLLSKGKIQPGQTWRDMPADFAARVLKNPAGFINQAQLTAGGAK